MSPRRSCELSSDEQTPPDLSIGRLALAGESIETHGWSSWDGSELSALATYHLHYLDWAWELAALPDGPALLVDALANWGQSHPTGAAPAWDPYPTSLRAWNLCGLDAELGLCAGLPDLPRLIDDHHRVIRLLLERDLGGNHLIANLKALAGIAVWRADNHGLSWALTRLDRTLRRQILADGGHEERSPAYHARVLGDLMDLDELLDAEGGPRPSFLERAISEMQSWLAAMTAPDHSLPNFNDGDTPPRPAIARLLLTGPSEQDSDLRASGFIVRRPRPDVMVVVDVGGPGPRDQPGHAHAGIGSYALWHSGSWVLRNNGSSTYAPGPQRQFERSSAGQNVLTVEGQNQVEQWAAFRVGRVPRVASSVPLPRSATFSVAHDGYRVDGRPIITRRRFEVSDAALTVDDSIEAPHPVRVAVCLHTMHEVEDREGTGVDVGQLQVRFLVPEALDLAVEGAAPATGLGRVTEGSRVVASVTLGPDRPLTTRIGW